MGSDPRITAKSGSGGSKPPPVGGLRDPFDLDRKKGAAKPPVQPQPPVPDSPAIISGGFPLGPLDAYGPPTDAGQSKFVGVGVASGGSEHRIIPHVLALDMGEDGPTYSKLPGRVYVVTGASVTRGDGRKKNLFPPPAATDDSVNEWLNGGDWGDLKDKTSQFKAADLCLGAAVLTRGCTPERYTPRVDTFSTNVDAIQQQQFVIGGCLVAPFVAVYAVPAVASAATPMIAGATRWLASLFEWARPLVAAQNLHAHPL